MQFRAAIFDMDGLLIDSEPLWQEAGSEIMAEFGLKLSDEQYHSSTGLRTPEWVAHWFAYYGIDSKHAADAIQRIESSAIEKIKESGQPLPGVRHVFEFFRDRHFKIGLASSSPLRLIEAVVTKLDIESFPDSISSAESLPFGKPHPQVFINCATALKVSPGECICFEDSFNGMIAAKAARMKCVVVPPPHYQGQNKWDAADAKLSSLNQMDEKLFQQLTGSNT